jgi:hypothetical protein
MRRTTMLTRAVYRSQETQQQASERGWAFHKRIYGRNTEFDPQASVEASPDYTFVVRGECGMLIDA